MHTGSRAFCFLMALAATGADCASAAVMPASSADAGHYCVESQPAKASELKSAPSFALVNHVLAVMAIGQIIAAPVNDVASSPKAADFSVTPHFAIVPLTIGTRVYDANGRVTASLADANERQLLFVKITRG